jgi:hypothetical protein
MELGVDAPWPNVGLGVDMPFLNMEFDAFMFLPNLELGAEKNIISSWIVIFMCWLLNRIDL